MPACIVCLEGTNGVLSAWDRSIVFRRPLIEQKEVMFISVLVWLASFFEKGIAMSEEAIKKSIANRIDPQEVEHRIRLGKHLLSIRDRYSDPAWGTLLRDLSIERDFAWKCMRIAIRFGDDVRREKMEALNLPMKIIERLSSDDISPALVDTFLHQATTPQTVDGYLDLLARLEQEARMANKESDAPAERIKTFRAVASHYDQLRQVAIKLYSLALELNKLADFP